MMINDLPIIMIRCLIGTIIVEAVVALIIGIRMKNDLINIILVNILTNPLVVSISFALNVFWGLAARNICLIILEIVAIIIEAIIYCKYLTFKKLNPYLLAVVLNLSSYLIGMLINMIK